MKSFLVGTLWFSSFLLPVQGEDIVDLLTAGNYAILSKAGITNVPDSVIAGNIAVSPITGASLTGFGLALDSGSSFSTSEQIIGEVFGADYAAPTPSILSTAVLDMEAAYLDAKGRPNSEADRKDLGAGILDGIVHGGPNTPLTPGVYTFADYVTITNDIYFQGSATDVFIIQVAGYMTQAANVNVILKGGAKAENIVWQVAGYVTLFTGAHMEGIILSATAVNMNTGSSLNGRILAQTAVTLDAVTILEPPPPPAVVQTQLFVDCMASPRATPDAPECAEKRADIHQDVLNVLSTCTGFDMGYADEQQDSRQLNSRGEEEAEEQSQRELPAFLVHCFSRNLYAYERMMCCFQSRNTYYSYCGAPLGNRRLQEGSYHNETALTTIAAECTDQFKDLAERTPACFGSSKDVFCRTIQVSLG